MAGRADYEERRESRIDRLNSAASSAQAQSSAAYTRSHDLVKDIPLGQPNIRGALTGVMNKSSNAMDKAVELSIKAGYYADKAAAAENNKAISSDDPQAIEKLKAKVSRLEAEREKVKAFNKAARKNGTEPAPWYTLPYLGRDIKAAKERIAKLEALDARPTAEDIIFEGGRIVENVEQNRIQIFFDERPDDERIKTLKSWGFHWAHSEGAWQRLRNANAIYAAKQAIK